MQASQLDSMLPELQSMLSIHAVHSLNIRPKIALQANDERAELNSRVEGGEHQLLRLAPVKEYDKILQEVCRRHEANECSKDNVESILVLVFEADELFPCEVQLL